MAGYRRAKPMFLIRKLLSRGVRRLNQHQLILEEYAKTRETMTSFVNQGVIDRHLTKIYEPLPDFNFVFAKPGQLKEHLEQVSMEIDQP